jgi:hypothetical protein
MKGASATEIQRLLGGLTASSCLNMIELECGIGATHWRLLQVMHSDSSLGSSIHPQTPDHREMLQHHQHDRHRHQAPLSTLMSLDHEASHASAAL